MNREVFRHNKDKEQEDEERDRYSMYHITDRGEVYIKLVGKRKGKRNCRCESTIKIDFREDVWGCGQIEMVQDKNQWDRG
jgi:hypothetical protein